LIFFVFGSRAIPASVTEDLIYGVIFAGQSADDQVIFRETVEGFEPRVGDHAAVLDLHPILGPPVAQQMGYSAPCGGHHFRAPNPGDPFLFNLRALDNFIVGGGFFAHSNLFPISLAWDAFREKNGAATFDGIRIAGALS